MLLFTSAAGVSNQIGVDLQICPDQSILPPDDDLDPKLRLTTDPVVTTDDLSNPSPLQKSVYSRVHVPDGDVPVVFFPGKLKTPDNRENKAVTCRFAENKGLILISPGAKTWTLAHELGHLLANCNHDTEPDHVMTPTDGIKLNNGQSFPIFTTGQTSTIQFSQFSHECPGRRAGGPPGWSR
jgi:hypothetical protein